MISISILPYHVKLYATLIKIAEIDRPVLAKYHRVPMLLISTQKKKELIEELTHHMVYDPNVIGPKVFEITKDKITTWIFMFHHI